MKPAAIQFDLQNPPDFAAFKFCYAVSVTIQWPSQCECVNGRKYSSTGKVGTNHKTRLPAAEYACGASRVWLLADGTIEED